jgi:hypothetical protein
MGMAEINLTQAEADGLFNMEKITLNNDPWDFPTQGMKIEIPLTSTDKRERFSLDIARGTINLQKVKFQNRTRQVVILARLEMAGPSHHNPDDTEIPTPHIHLYREGFADKWAFKIPSEAFRNLTDQWDTLQDFMAFCHVTRKPNILKVMF